MLGWLLWNIYFAASNFPDMKDNTMTWKNQDYFSNLLYVNVVRYFQHSQQNFPFQNKHSGDDFVLGL